MHDVVVLNCVYIALSNDVLVRTVRSASIGIFVLFFHLEGNSGSQNDYHLNLVGWNLFQPPSGHPLGLVVSVAPLELEFLDGQQGGKVEWLTYPTLIPHKNPKNFCLFDVHILIVGCWSSKFMWCFRWCDPFPCRVSFVDSSTLLKWSFGLIHSNCVLGHFGPCAKEHSTAVADVACWPECVNSPVSEAGVWDGGWGSPARLWHC